MGASKLSHMVIPARQKTCCFIVSPEKRGEGFHQPFYFPPFAWTKYRTLSSSFTYMLTAQSFMVRILCCFDVIVGIVQTPSVTCSKECRGFQECRGGIPSAVYYARVSFLGTGRDLIHWIQAMTSTTGRAVCRRERGKGGYVLWCRI